MALQYPIITKNDDGSFYHLYKRVRMYYHENLISCELLKCDKIEIGDIPNNTTQVSFDGYHGIIYEEMFPDSVIEIWLDFEQYSTQSLKPGMLPHNLKRLDIGEDWNGIIEKGAIPYGTEKVRIYSWYGCNLYSVVFQQPKENCWVPSTVKTFDIFGEKKYKRGTPEFDNRISTYYKYPKNAN